MDHPKSLHLAQFFATLVAGVLILMDLTYIALLTADLPPWTSAAQYARDFRLVSFLPIFAGSLLVIVYPLLAAAWHATAVGEQKTWTTAGLIFGTLFAALSGTAYLIQLMIILPRVRTGNLDGFAMLAFANPMSVVWAMNYMGWFFFALSTLLFTGALGASRREQAIRICAVLCAGAAVLLLIGYARESFPLQIPMALGWFTIQPAIFVLLASHFSGRRTTPVD